MRFQKSFFSFSWNATEPLPPSWSKARTEQRSERPWLPASRSQDSRCSNRERRFCRDLGNSTNFTRDGVLKQNICRLAVTLHELGPGLDNPYYRGLGCADFSEQRRLVGAGCTIGGFSPIASENLTRQSPRREVLLAPAHRPRCISSRSPQFAASIRPN